MHERCSEFAVAPEVGSLREAKGKASGVFVANDYKAGLSFGNRVELFQFLDHRRVTEILFTFFYPYSYS